MNVKIGKDEQIRWMNSLTNASNIVGRMPLGEGLAFTDVTSIIKDYANFFYDIEPNVTEHQKNIESCKTVEELEAMKDIIRMTDSVSMFNLWNEKKISLSK